MAALVKESAGQGKSASALKALLGALRPHFEKENTIVMPLLGLMDPLGEGRKIGNMALVRKLYAECAAEYGSMFEEHAEIRRLLAIAESAAEAEGRKDVVDTLAGLAHHARIEEEVLYPAAKLAGKVAVI